VNAWSSSLTDERGCHPSPVEQTPTIYEWGGGTESFERWLNRFYDLVEEEGTLAPLFGGTVSQGHRVHVLAWWVEVMGGPAAYTANLGGYPAMLSRHRGLAITPEQRRLFVTLLSQAADEVGLPADPEFRAAIIGYAEWGSRLAMHNSDPQADDVTTEAPVPRWGWGVAPPYQG
jgi:hemoglobin